MLLPKRLETLENFAVNKAEIASNFHVAHTSILHKLVSSCHQPSFLRVGFLELELLYSLKKQIGREMRLIQPEWYKSVSLLKGSASEKTIWPQEQSSEVDQGS